MTLAPLASAALRSLVTVGLCALASCRAARAAGPETGIWEGEAVEPCGLPTVVWLPHSGCSGVLVGPRLVLTAGHCVQGLDPPTVVFGEEVDAPARVVAAQACVANPAWTGLVDAEDFGYCLLSEAVELPLVPVAPACEQLDLAPGQPLVLAGFGQDELGVLGRKRHVEVSLSSVEPGLLRAGGEGLDSCLGDSGGPLMLPPGPGRAGWRVVGLIVGGEACGEGSVSVEAERALSWALADAGLEREAPLRSPLDPRDPPADSGAGWDQNCPQATVAIEPCEESPPLDDAGCACRASSSAIGWPRLGWLGPGLALGLLALPRRLARRRRRRRSPTTAP